MLSWLFGGDHIGEMAINGTNSVTTALRFSPSNVSIVFTDEPSALPSCNPIKEDDIEISSNGADVTISWSVSGPRKVKWEAKR